MIIECKEFYSTNSDLWLYENRRMRTVMIPTQRFGWKRNGIKVLVCDFVFDCVIYKGMAYAWAICFIGSAVKVKVIEEGIWHKRNWFGFYKILR